LVSHRIHHAGLHVRAWEVGAGASGSAIAPRRILVESGLDHILRSGLEARGSHYFHRFARLGTRIFRDLSRVVACRERGLITGDDFLDANDGIEVDLYATVEYVAKCFFIGRDVIEALDLSVREAQGLGGG